MYGIAIHLQEILNIINKGAEMTRWELDQFFDKTIQSCKATVTDWMKS